MNYLRFCFMGKSLSFLYFWRTVWPGIVFLADRFFFFSFSTLSISSCSFLACEVSTEKYTDSLMEFPLHVMSCFSFAAFKFSLSLIFWQGDYYVFPWTLLYVQFVWNSLGFMELDVPFPLQIWEVFCPSFFK